MPEDSDTRVTTMLIRLEAKLDVALAQHGAKLETHGQELVDHETRIRAVEGRPVVPADHEARLQAIEKQPTVTPAKLWAVVLGAGGLLAALSPLIDRIYS